MFPGLFWRPADSAKPMPVNDNELLTFYVPESNKSRFAAKLRYWWCWFVASVLLLFVATPALIFLWLINRRIWLYPLASWGAKTWLAACGATVKVTGLEHLLNVVTAIRRVEDHQTEPVL